MSRTLPKPIFIPISIIFVAVAAVFLITQIIAGLERTLETDTLTAYPIAIAMLIGLLAFQTFADPDKPRIRAATQILSFVVFMLIVLGNFHETSDDTSTAILILIVSLFLMRGLQWFTRHLRLDLANRPKKPRY
jgi:peptidoglycan/LPS O-acetylase OafA/YrhL